MNSSTPGFIAKKLCPELIFVPGHYNRYAEMSNQVMDILRDYDPNMAIGGADEAYLK
jgi:DNA polymerase kappa